MVAKEVAELNPRTMEVMRAQPLVVKGMSRDEVVAAVEAEARVEAVENTILQTKNYGQFKFDPSNRPVDYDRVVKLSEAIGKKNLLHLFPIVVDGSLTVIDGQHRLRAAELLDTPIFYIVSRQMVMEDAPEVVRNTKGWSQDEWLHHWCAMGKIDYVMVRDFWGANRWLPLSTAVNLCNSSGNRKGMFAKGLYIADSVPFAVRVCEMARDFSTWFKPYATTTFLGALVQLAADGRYSHKHMMMKMQYLSSKLVRCPTVDMYLAVITEIYNYKVPPERHIVFKRTNRTRVPSKV